MENKKTKTRGLRNNNPGNIRKSSDVYQGEIIPSQDSAFKQFKTMAYGYRAIFCIIYTYLTRYNLNTIGKIIGRWAPPNENHTQVYVDKVSEWSGIDRNEELTIYDGSKFIKIVAAMSKMENGIDADLEDVKTGFSLQSKIK